MEARKQVVLDPNETDPTFLRQLADFFESEEVREAVGEEGQKALLSFIPPATLMPHVVHVEPTIEVTECKTYDPEYAEANGETVPAALETTPFEADTIDIAYWTFDESRRRQVVNDCPDCTRGLSSRGFDMICPRLPRQTEEQGCHVGCVVACGNER